MNRLEKAKAHAQLYRGARRITSVEKIRQTKLAIVQDMLSDVAFANHRGLYIVYENPVKIGSLEYPTKAFAAEWTLNNEAGLSLNATSRADKIGGTRSVRIDLSDVDYSGSGSIDVIDTATDNLSANNSKTIPLLDVVDPLVLSAVEQGTVAAYAHMITICRVALGPNFDRFDK